MHYMLVILCVSLFGCVYTAQNKLILISLDGFRWDYLEKYKPPNLLQMAREGSKADYVKCTFVTNTFPCHITIVTGLYQESHGIVGNYFYDPKLDDVFVFKNSTISTDPKWWTAEPIWITATKNNVSSGTVFWPGSEVPYDGIRQKKWLAFNKSLTFDNRIDLAVDWLTNGDVDFVTLYFELPDKSGHGYGPDSNETNQAVQNVDKMMGILDKKLKAANIYTKTNIIATSDHGMALSVPEKVIQLSGLLNMSNVKRVLESGPYFAAIPTPNHEEDLYRNLVNISRTTYPNMTVYKKTDFPARWHYSSNPRIPGIIALADEGYYIVYRKPLSAWRKNAIGSHGYDPKYPSMRPFFIARGPDIRTGYKAGPINQVDIYNLMAHLLGVPPVPNNGTWANVKDMLAINSGTRSNDKLLASVCAVVNLIVLYLHVQHT